MKRYIIDTDIGDDIDDAFALDLALKLELDLVCVTTVFRNVRERAAIVKKMLRLYGRKDIPVYAGHGATLDGRDENFRLCQWTPDLEWEEYAPDNSSPDEAVDAILAAARSYKKDFWLLAIGPLTNAAAAILKDGEAMRGIGGIIMMGGDFVNHYAEWNIRCDIAAAEAVFSSGVNIVAFGHEVTSQTRLTPAQQQYVFSMKQDSYHAYLAELSRLWYKSKPEGWLMVMHDVLVVRYAADSAFCKTVSAPVEVERQGKYTSGMTVNLSKMEPPVSVSNKIEYAAEVDIPAFIEYFMNEIGFHAEGGNKNYEKNTQSDGKFVLDWDAGSDYDRMRKS